MSPLATTMCTTTSTKKAKPMESSWEDIDYGSGLPDWTSVKNTFIDCPAERSWSLEEFLQMTEQKCKSCPSSGVLMHQSPKRPGSQTILEESVSGSGSLSESEGSTTDSDESQTAPVESDSDDVPWENITYGDLPAWTSVKNTFIDCPADRSFSLEEFMGQNEQKCKSCPSSGVMMHLSSEIQMPQSYYTIFEEEGELSSSCSSATTDEYDAHAPASCWIPPPRQMLEQILMPCYPDLAPLPAENRMVLNIAPFLPEQEAVPNIGSQAHIIGQCTPCGFVHKPDGCTKGASCPYCHLCPEGTIKQRKQMKKLAVKVRKMEAFAHRQQMWMGGY